MKPLWKYEDLKCQECDGTGEVERNIDGMDAMCVCTWCYGSGIVENLISDIDQIAAKLEDTLHGEESKLIGQIRKRLSL